MPEYPNQPHICVCELLAEEVTFFAPHIFPARDNPEFDVEKPAGRYLVIGPLPDEEE